MRVADYVARFAVEKGIRHAFLVTGGGAMHLNDAIGREKRLEYVAFHHEQACAMAAESYCRTIGKPALVNVTTGPGGTNAITGVFGAWTDSIAMVVVSGQVKRETTMASTGLPLRQLGDQEVDIVTMVKSITKYAVMVTDPKSIRRHLEEAFHLATTGRPGPVWIDIPIDVQAAMIDPIALEPWEGGEAILPAKPTSDIYQDILERLHASKRPVVFAGSGVRTSGMHAQFLQLIDKLGVPVVSGWNAYDTLWDSHPLAAGRPGSVGDRGGNFTVQNADFLLVLGSRLNIRQISYNYASFARHAYKVMVDVDAAELQKPTLKIDLPIHADLRDFLPGMLATSYEKNPQHAEYLAWCRARVAKYPTVLPEYWLDDSQGINPYCFVDALTRQLPEGAVTVTGDGTACVVTFQAAHIKKGQRYFHNSGSAPMGFDLPGAIGAAIACPNTDVYCIAGDGSIQMNVQELATIVHHRLAVKIFVLNNKGYHSIRQTQHNYFADNIVGCGEESGLTFPDFCKVAQAYGIPAQSIRSHAELDSAIQHALAQPGAFVTEIHLDLRQSFAPKTSSKRLPDGRMVSPPLEDLAPFLSREELASNMLVPMEVSS